MADAPRPPVRTTTSVTIDEVLSLAGRLDDEPGFDAPRERFRRFLQSHVTRPAIARVYIEQCQHTPGDQHHRALQDLVVLLGRFLGFETTFGAYTALAGAIKFEGHWRSGSRLIVAVEVRREQSAAPGLESLTRSLAALTTTSPDAQTTAGLLVLASSYVSQKKIDETLSSAAPADPVSVIAIRNLVSLAELAIEGTVTHDDVVRMLVSRLPIDFVVSLLERRRADEPAAVDALTSAAETRPEPAYWIATVGPDHATRPDEFLELVVGKRKIFGLIGGRGAGTAEHGDGLCFYIAGRGVVGHARVTEPPDDAGGIRAAHRFRQLLHLDDIKLYLDAPVELDPAVRLQLEVASAGGRSNPGLVRISAERFNEVTIRGRGGAAPTEAPALPAAAAPADAPTTGPARRRR